MKFKSLQERLKGPISDSLKEKLGRNNPNSLPGIEKVTVNVGINKSRMDGSEMLDYIVESLKQITGQKPALRSATKSVSNFKIREGMVVGAQVTMRGKKMYDFLDRLIHVALPRVRDFRGVKTKFDGHGNYSMGIIEHTVFLEVPLPDASKVFGFQITITTTADNDEEAIELLKAVGVPFRKKS
ncbi:50S ribosomal protein L5 [Candidatus Peribacteria bacterium]|jgi:large subunit ribosomal protein L5|nr:50S ribosomal protein L5 [Candidatus Peribacteria bacterium]MBT4021377.1 50S ribosomal protein L5 [Candidatus Peribacteria bacterium]MBT4240549.1 50S ribosomal protein L5 [Candidatus Peribacteria bacterium]MBT4474399.1 50S ribosomal protein L5 [Candidatus Peribacteria bacterium]